MRSYTGVCPYIPGPTKDIPFGGGGEVFNLILSSGDRGETVVVIHSVWNLTLEGDRRVVMVLSGSILLNAGTSERCLNLGMIWNGSSLCWEVQRLTRMGAWDEMELAVSCCFVDVARIKYRDADFDFVSSSEHNLPADKYPE